MRARLLTNQKTCKIILEYSCYCWVVAFEWSFLTNHGRVLLCIAHDPGVRLREIASELGITERGAYGIVADLAGDGYIVKQRDGRRTRYEIQEHLPLREPTTRERTIGEVLRLLVRTTTPKRRTSGSLAGARSVRTGRPRTSASRTPKGTS
jgi:hypothetical protein